MLGFLFAIISSASFGMNNAAVRRGVLTGSVTQGLYVTVILGVPLFLVASLVTGQLFDAAAISLRGYLLLVSAGVVHFYVGRYCNYRSVAALGANRSAPIRNMAIPVSVLIAIFFLGEEVTPFMIFGMVLIMIGPAIIFEFNSQGPKAPAGGAGSDAAKAHGFVIKQAEGYLFGTLTALMYGLSPVLVRSALTETNLAIYGVFVSYSAASVLMLISLAIPGRLAAIQNLEKSAGRWFLLATLMVFFAQLFRYLALGIAPVTIVSPLQRTSSIFALAFAYLINRDAESFGFRIILGIILAIVGSVALAF